MPSLRVGTDPCHDVKAGRKLGHARRPKIRPLEGRPAWIHAPRHAEATPLARHGDSGHMASVYAGSNEAVAPQPEETAVSRQAADSNGGPLLHVGQGAADPRMQIAISQALQFRSPSSQRCGADVGETLTDHATDQWTLGRCLAAQSNCSSTYSYSPRSRAAFSLRSM
jgi:hypothetical protein